MKHSPWLTLRVALWVENEPTLHNFTKEPSAMRLLTMFAVRRRTLFAQCFAALMFVWCNGTFAEDTKTPAGQRIFYTGHSFHMFVPSHIDQLVKSANIQGHKQVGAQGIGGSRVIQHWDLADDKNNTKAALISGGVDVFTMAAHVLIPDDGITKFTELGLKHNPNLRLYVQGSWFPFDVPRGSPGFITDNAQRDNAKIADLQTAVDEWRIKLEAQVDDLNKQHGKRAVYIIPVGNAVNKLRALIADGKFPGITNQSKLFRDPIGHGNGQVMALTSYCNFATIYRISPVGLKLGERGVDDAQHAILQQIAWETVSKYPYAVVTKEKSH